MSTDPHDPGAWLTATVRPAGLLDRRSSSRFGALLEAVSATASIVVVDLEAALVRGPSAAAVIEEAASAIEAHGGCLVCVHADEEARRSLGATRAVVV